MDHIFCPLVLTKLCNFCTMCRLRATQITFLNDCLGLYRINTDVIVGFSQTKQESTDMICQVSSSWLHRRLHVFCGLVFTTNHLPNLGPFFMYCYLSGYVGISTDIYKDENTATYTFLVAFTTPSLSRSDVKTCSCTFPIYQGIYSYTFLHHFGSGIEIWIVLSMY
jgi:hypothetical protein